MENTEKTTHLKVQKFIENAKKLQIEAQELERQQQEAKRDAFLISLGLYTEEKVNIPRSEAMLSTYDGVFYDEEKKQYYVVTKNAVDVTDEEFEEIKKYALAKEEVKQKESVELDNSAEKFLDTLNDITLVICCIAAVILIVIGIGSYSEGYLVGVGIGLAILSIISYACVRVVLNISNNLHKINSKIK